MDGRPKRIKKFAFTSVCVYNRLRVDGASVRIKDLEGPSSGSANCLVRFFDPLLCCIV